MTCKICGNPIHWNQLERKWYHDLLASVLGCHALVIEPAEQAKGA